MLTMPPKRKAEEMDSASAKGKKTTVSTKTTVTTVTIEEPQAKKKPDALPKKPRAKASGQMPLQLPAIPGYGALAGPSSSLVAAHAMDAKKSDGGGGKFVWLIYHKSGRQEARLMGAYTGAKSALKNAKVVIDTETGGAEGRLRQGATLSDFSSNIQAEQGVIYEVKHQIGGGKDVVSFKKVRLNEDLGEGDCYELSDSDSD